jgi:hypothetical protein
MSMKRLQMSSSTIGIDSAVDERIGTRQRSRDRIEYGQPSHFALPASSGVQGGSVGGQDTGEPPVLPESYVESLAPGMDGPRRAGHLELRGAGTAQVLEMVDDSPSTDPPDHIVVVDSASLMRVDALPQIDDARSDLIYLRTADNTLWVKVTLSWEQIRFDNEPQLWSKDLHSRELYPFTLDDRIKIESTDLNASIIASIKSEDTSNRFWISADGTHFWGSGEEPSRWTADISLHHLSDSLLGLFSDDSFRLQGTGQLQFEDDVALQRGAENRLDLIAGDNFRLQTGELQFGADVGIGRVGPNIGGTRAAVAWSVGGPHLQLHEEVSAPDVPAVGYQRLFAGTDGHLYQRTSSDQQRCLSLWKVDNEASGSIAPYAPGKTLVLRSDGSNVQVLAVYISGSNPTFQLGAAGEHIWGPGGASAPDTQLLRWEAATLGVGLGNRLHGGIWLRLEEQPNAQHPAAPPAGMVVVYPLLDRLYARDDQGHIHDLSASSKYTVQVGDALHDSNTVNISWQSSAAHAPGYTDVGTSAISRCSFNLPTTTSNPVATLDESYGRWQVILDNTPGNLRSAQVALGVPIRGLGRKLKVTVRLRISNPAHWQNVRLVLNDSAGSPNTSAVSLAATTSFVDFTSAEVDVSSWTGPLRAVVLAQGQTNVKALATLDVESFTIEQWPN